MFVVFHQPFLLPKGPSDSHSQAVISSLSVIVVNSRIMKQIVPRYFSGFGGLVVSMLASSTQDRGFVPGRSRRIFRAKKSSACLLRRRSKAVCLMSQICDMLKNPAVYRGSRNLQAKLLGHFSPASVLH
jgi:hypothetical protein